MSKNNQNKSFFSIFKRKKKGYVFSPEDVKESNRVVGLKKEIRSITQLLELKDTRIDSLMLELKEYYATKDQNKLWDLAEKFMTGGGARKQQITAPALLTESGRQVSLDLTDKQIKTQLKEFNKTQIRGALKLGDDVLKSIIYNKFPGVTSKTINRALEIAKEV